jgi:hypothetical protein
MNVSLQDLKGTFESGIEEHNPFFQWEGIPFEEGIVSMLAAFEKCESNWRKNVLKRWSRKSL